MARAVEPYANISAQELLSTGASCSGWVMKESTSGLRLMIKALGWPWYYMILNSGCLYLYKHSGDDNYSEVFPLTNYSVCDAQEVTKYTWAFKLINESYSMKTLFFAVDSEFDLNRWQEAITEDKKIYCCPVSEVDPAQEHRSININRTDPSCSPPALARRPNARTIPHDLELSRNDPTDVPAGQASVSDETTKVHSRPHAKVTQQVTGYIPSPHSETNVTTKQRPFSVLAGPSQENRLTQSNVPPWFGTQQEARIRPLPKRSQQKKNEPVQFFQRSLQEAEAHSPSELPSSFRSPLTASSSTPMKSEALERGAPDGQSVKSGQREQDKSSLTLIHDMDRSQATMLLKDRPGVYILRKSKTKQSTMVLSVGTGDKVVHYRISYDEEQGYSLREQGTPRFPEIKDLLSHYSSFDLPTHDLKLTVAATYR